MTDTSKPVWNLSPADVLDAMADVIDERGHVKHELEDRRTGAVCLFGAYNVVRHGSPQGDRWGTTYWTKRYHDEAILQSLLREASLDASASAGDQELVLIRWNNAPERTPDQVSDACRWAAKRARDEETGRAS